MRSTTSKSSIIDAALRLFGERGIGATSLRDVARAASVSPALVVHHFGGKQGLIAATDEAALLAFGEAYIAASSGEGDDDVLRQRTERTVGVMRAQPEVCAYLGRALVELTPNSSGLLRMMLAGGQAEIDALAEQGALRTDADRPLATLQHFFLIWAPLSFTPILERVLGGPLEGENLERWAQANVELLGRGLYR